MKKLIRIAIDGNEANIANRVGSNIYAYEIIKNLEKLVRNQPDITVTVCLAFSPQPDLPAERAGWSYKVIKPTFLWTQLALPSYLFMHRDEFDVFYTPGHYAPRHCPIPYVSSVMDLGFLYFPDQFKHKDLVQLKNWTEYSVKHASKVIAISQFTKQDVIKQYHKPETDVVVAYPDVDSSTHPVSMAAQNRVLKKFKITSPYILYVGTLQPRKNLVRLIEAFEETYDLIHNPLKKVNLTSNYELRDVVPFKNVQLVVAGKVGWLADEILSKIKNSPIKDHIILTGFINDSAKNALYQGASASVLVGTYEGFGIPALESFHHGVIPVVSETSSLPEVVGKAGVLVDPLNIKSISNGLSSVLLLAAKERAKLRREARKQSLHFSWVKSAKIILETLVKIAQSESI